MNKSKKEVAVKVIRNQKRFHRQGQVEIKILKFLKTEHGMTHGFANMVVHEYRGGIPSVDTETDLVAAQYAGPKEGLKPIYDALIKVANGLGKDVEVALVAALEAEAEAAEAPECIAEVPDSAVRRGLGSKRST